MYDTIAILVSTVKIKLNRKIKRSNKVTTITHQIKSKQSICDHLE